MTRSPLLSRSRARSFAVVAVATLAALSPLTSCTGIANDRADVDEQIGHRRTSFMDVDVDDGLACIRSIEPGKLFVRAQAPLFRMRVTLNDDASALDLVVDNVLPDATLEAHDAGGAAMPVVVAAGARPTQRVARIEAHGVRTFDVVVRAPDEGDRRPYRFALLADVQEAIADVGDIYARINEDPSIRFVLFSGDLTRRGTRPELEEFERREHELRIPLYATLGNHELAADEVYFQQMYGRGSFHFAFRGVHYTLLDSGSATISPKTYRWLDGWLAQGRDAVHVVATHIPPIDPVGVRNGSFANRSEASRLLASLASGGVDLTLYGHVHSFYAFANAGIPAYISGGGGAVPERLDGVHRNYLVIDVDPGAPGGGRVLSVGVVRVD